MANIKNRKKIEEMIYKTMSLLDPTGYNAKRYETLFAKMDDKKFTTWMNKMMNDEDNNFTLETTPFVKSHTDLDIANVKKAADYLGVPLDEYIYMPFENPNGSPLRSREKTPVGYVQVKRLEQLLSKKNAYASEIGQRDSKTGQVVANDKAGRISDMENYALLVLGAKDALKEFLGPRADDMVMKQDMLKDIARDGYTSLSNMDNDIANKTALNTLDMYYTSAGMVTDLITPGYSTRRDLDSKEVKQRLQDKY